MQAIDDRFRFLAGIIQEIQVGGVLDIGGHTGGIEEELAFRGSGLVFPFASARSVCVGASFAGCASAISSGNGLIDGS